VARRVGIVSVGNTEYTSTRRETREKSEISNAAVKQALNNVGLSLKDIEAVVYSSVDGFEGINRSERLQPCFGQHYNLPLYSLNTGGTGGASAFKEAYHMVAGGLYDLVAVFAAATFNVVVDNNQVLNTAWHPFFEKPIGENVITYAARLAMRYMEKYKWPEEIFAEVAAKAHRNAANNPYAHLRKGYTFDEIMASPILSYPLRLYEVCPVSSGAVCMIMAEEGRAKSLSQTPVWIKEVMSISDTFLTGYRDSLKFDRLEVLAKRIYSKAGIKDPMKELDVAETFVPMANFEHLHYEAMGFCEEGKAPELVRDGITDINGKLPVNCSGTVLCTNSGISASLTRFAEIVLQLTGKAEGRQVKGPPRIGLAHAWGGSNGQYHSIGILERD
jgi:acetyl-CoA C-acetyltransferase